MITATLITFINLFVLAFNFLLIARVLSSWLMPGNTNAITRLIYELTEPILAPIRKIVPGGSMIDLSPLIAFFLLQGIQILANNFL